MIEVNLLRAMNSDSTIATSVFSGDASSDQKTMATKLVYLLVPVILLIVWEQYSVGELNNQMNLMRAQVNQKTGQLSKYGPQVEAVRKIKEEKVQLDGRVEAIKNLSQERLTLVRAMDALHNITPKEVWLDEIQLKGKGFVITGFASEDLVVSRFMQNLEESIFFNEIILVGTEESRSSDGIVKKFEISCVLGK